MFIPFIALLQPLSNTVTNLAPSAMNFRTITVGLEIACCEQCFCYVRVASAVFWIYVSWFGVAFRFQGALDKCVCLIINVCNFKNPWCKLENQKVDGLMF